MTEPVITLESAAADLHGTVSEFERLRERAHEQIAALAVTIGQLERLRAEVERHLPRQRP